MKVGLLGAGRIGALHAGVLARDPAVEAGIPAFCEKPIALGYEETVEIAQEVKASGATLQIGFQRRFDAGYAEARRLIEAGSLGTIYSLRLATHDPDPPPEEYIPDSGGIFRDLHIHDFDILRWLTGSEVEEVYATGSVRNFDFFATHGDVDTSAALIRMQDSVVVGMDRRTPLRSVEPGIPASEKAAYPNFQERFLEAYTAELQHFLSLVRGEADNPCTATDALEALRIAMAADLSLAEHRPVSPSEVG